MKESMNETNPIRTGCYRQDLTNVIRGFCMGAADTVPGVSGGTIALIMGHYSRLVRSISHFDTDLLSMLRTKQFRKAAEHLDARFLIALGSGVALGIILLAGLMHHLLDAYLPETFAVFLGLLVSSLWVVVKSVDRWSTSRISSLLAGTAIAVMISMLPTSSGNASLPYLFLSASIAICAMILPGISGAFILLVLGVYHPITGLIKDFAKLQFSVEGFTQLVVVAMGCTVGMLAFSRLLRCLLERQHGITMAGLTGLMLGSVVKLWPLQMATPETATLKLKFRVMQYFSPSDWQGSSIIFLITLAVIAAVAVIVIERFANAKQSTSPSPLDN